MKSKKQKRLEAEERANDRELRKPEEQLRLIEQRPGMSERERAKLEGQIVSGGMKKLAAKHKGAK